MPLGGSAAGIEAPQGTAAPTRAGLLARIHSGVPGLLRYTPAMPARPRKRKKRKNPAAVALGRRGGKKGGPKGGLARMKQLTPAERSELGRKAARARWGKKTK